MTTKVFQRLGTAPCKSKTHLFRIKTANNLANKNKIQREQVFKTRLLSLTDSNIDLL